MKTVTQVTRLTGCSVRTLHHYDAIGLLKPSRITQAGYRLYDDTALERLFLILLFRECGLSLEEIRQMLDSPDSRREEILDAQIALLTAKVQHLQDCIHLANAIKQTGVNNLKRKNWNPKEVEAYSAQAEALYGKTEAYAQYREKAKNRSQSQESTLGDQVMDFFVRLGALKHLSPESAEVQNWVKQLQSFFTQHYYNCTPQILIGLAQMYAGGGSMTENIDAAGGAGTGEFARKAIEIYCRQQ